MMMIADDDGGYRPPGAEDSLSPAPGPVAVPNETRPSTWPPFSETGRFVMLDAIAYSRAQDHEQIDLEALLVAAVRSSESAVRAAIATTGLSAEDLASSIRDDAKTHPYRLGQRPFSHDADAVVRAAQSVADRRRASYIGAADVLVAALKVTTDWPACSLHERGLTANVVYAEAAKLPRKLIARQNSR